MTTTSDSCASRGLAWVYHAVRNRPYLPGARIPAALPDEHLLTLILHDHECMVSGLSLLESPSPGIPIQDDFLSLTNQIYGFVLVAAGSGWCR